MIQFAAGFYVCGFIMTSSMVYVALEQEGLEWSQAKRIAGSAAFGLFWLALFPWIWKRAAGRAQQGHNG